MREYFTVMVTENSKENLGLLTEKLNEGFYIDNQIHIGKSVIIVLQKRNNPIPVPVLEMTEVSARNREMSYGSSNLGGF